VPLECEENKHFKLVSDTHRVDTLAECPVLDIDENAGNDRARPNRDMLAGNV